jgi:ABC-type nitrate/sulfonate/bicarbonate transport system substrate-binding protein
MDGMAKRKSKKDEYQAAVEAVVEAARRAESASQKFDEGWKRLSKDKSDADKALREALDNLQYISEGRKGNS